MFLMCVTKLFLIDSFSNLPGKIGISSNRLSSKINVVILNNMHKLYILSIWLSDKSKYLKFFKSTSVYIFKSLM